MHKRNNWVFQWSLKEKKFSFAQRIRWFDHPPSYWSNLRKHTYFFVCLPFDNQYTLYILDEGRPRLFSNVLINILILYIFNIVLVNYFKECFSLDLMILFQEQRLEKISSTTRKLTKFNQLLNKYKIVFSARGQSNFPTLKSH